MASRRPETLPPVFSHPARIQEGGKDHNEWPLTIQNLAIHEAGEFSTRADPEPLHLGVLIPPHFLLPLQPHHHQLYLYPHPLPYAYPPNMMNEEEFSLHASDKIGEQGGALHSNSQQQVHGYYQQQTPDNGNYWYYGRQQQQVSYGGGYGNNQFSMSPEVSGGIYDGYYGGQQYTEPDYANNQFGSPLTQMNWDYYRRQEPPHEGYYNTQGSASVNMNYGYYGRAQHAIDQQTEISVPGTDSSYCSRQQNSQLNSSGVLGMQTSISAQTIDYNESSAYHNGYHRGPVRRHSMPNLQEQILAEQPRYYEVLHTNPSYSAPTSDTRLSQNTDYASPTCPNRLPNADFVFTGGSDCLWNSGSTLAGDFDRSQNVNPQMDSNNPVFNNCPRNLPNHSPGILYGPGRLHNSNSARVASARSMNRNSALINGRFMNTNTALITVDFPSGGGDSAPIRGLDRAKTKNYTDCNAYNLMNTNSALIRLPHHRCPGPQSPRWQYEDAIAAASTLSPLSEAPSVGEDGREEKSSSNIFSSLFLKSMLQAPTAFENLARVDAISGIPASIPRCPYILKGRCQAALGSNKCCSGRVHFKRVVHAHTDVRLGDCSFLDSCDLADKCPYIHYAPEHRGVSRSPFDRMIGEINEVPREEERGMGRLADHVGPVRVMDKLKVCFSNLID